MGNVGSTHSAVTRAGTEPLSESHLLEKLKFHEDYNMNDISAPTLRRRVYSWCRNTWDRVAVMDAQFNNNKWKASTLSIGLNNDMWKELETIVLTFLDIRYNPKPTNQPVQNQQSPRVEWFAYDTYDLLVYEMADDSDQPRKKVPFVVPRVYDDPAWAASASAGLPPLPTEVSTATKPLSLDNLQTSGCVSAFVTRHIRDCCGRPSNVDWRPYPITTGRM